MEPQGQLPCPLKSASSKAQNSKHGSLVYLHNIKNDCWKVKVVHRLKDKQINRPTNNTPKHLTEGGVPQKNVFN